MSTVSEKSLLNDTVRALAAVLLLLMAIGLYGRFTGNPELAHLLELTIALGMVLTAAGLWQNAEGRRLVLVGAVGMLTVSLVRLGEYANVAFVEKGWVSLVTILGLVVGIAAILVAFDDDL